MSIERDAYHWQLPDGSFQVFEYPQDDVASLHRMPRCRVGANASAGTKLAAMFFNRCYRSRPGG